MSARKRKLEVAENARHDIRSLLLYTRDHWGVWQRDRYRALLDDAFALLLSNPFIGSTRDELGPAIRARVVERHVIYYEAEGELVRILRVMHQRTEPQPRHFESWKGE